MPRTTLHSLVLAGLIVSLPAAIAAQSAPPAPQALPVAETFVPLFNGRDLSGWFNINCAPDTWTVRDGMIHSTGAPICELRTERMYENFVLELEYQHLKAGGNAGVFIWSDALPARGEPFLRAIEVQVLDGQETANYTSHGDVFAIHGAQMTPDRPHPAGWARSLPRERRAKPAGQWNHYRITARDGVLTLAVNGADVSGGFDISPRKGYISLESEGSPVLFRNIRIAELPSTGAVTAAQTASDDDGFRALYNGQDLRGWRAPGVAANAWRAKDWVLSYAVAPGTAAAVGEAGASDAAAAGVTPASLIGAVEYGDFTLMVDWRIPKPSEPDASAPASTVASSTASDRTRSSSASTSTAASGMTRMPRQSSTSAMRGADGAPIETPAVRLSVTPRVSATAPAGEWNRSIFTVRGDSVTLTVNGQPVTDGLPSAGAVRGRIALTPDGTTEFANLFVKPLD